MTFSRQIFLIFGSITLLFSAFSFMAMVMVQQIKSENDELIEDKIHVFSRAQSVANSAKSVEAAGAHVLISGRPEAYEAFKASHWELRANLKSLTEDPKFTPYKDEIIKVAELEKRAEALGRGPFLDRLKKRIPVEKVAEILSRTGLPLIREIHDRLRKVESSSLANWQEASRSIQALQSRSRDTVRMAFMLIAALMLLLSGALWAILRQRNQLDEKRQRLLEKEQAISSARKSAVEIVAHDLRNPLATIQMCLDSMTEADEQERSTFHQIGKNSAQNALRLISQILDHTKIERSQLSLDKSKCDMRTFLDEQIGMLKNLCLAKNVRLIVQIDKDLPYCLCDTLRVGQVLSNLIGNALKFSGSGREIRLAVDIQGSEIHFAIKDEGPGIEPSQIDRIFDRYWQSPGRMQDGGLGLGLAISKSIVDAHGGRIWVVSTVGVGSTFCFTLPLTA